MSAPGVNLVGFLNAEFGQGEVARRLDAALRHAGIPHRTIPYEEIPHRQDHPFEHASSDADHDVNVLCLNAEHLIGFAARGSDLLVDHYSIGVWFWETSRFPDYLKPALKFVDELWVASNFVASAIGAETSIPVVTFPLPVEVPKETAVTRADLGLPEDRFVFTFVFDFYSTVERKNPGGLDRGVQAGVPARRRGVPPRQEHQRRPLPGGAPAARAGGRRTPGHPRGRRLRSRRPRSRLRRAGGRCGVTPPQRGLRPHARRGDGARQARDRHRLLRKPRVHERGEQLSRPVRAHRTRRRRRLLSGRLDLGRAGPRRGGKADAASRRAARGGERARGARTQNDRDGALARGDGTLPVRAHAGGRGALDEAHGGQDADAVTLRTTSPAARSSRGRSRPRASDGLASGCASFCSASSGRISCVTASSSTPSWTR